MTQTGKQNPNAIFSHEAEFMVWDLSFKEIA